ncbi:MAG: hypothetical protein H0T84_11650 [Tatlockia sp.]|nr:hypothetical protein [Tatlockia sp.]
MTEVDVTLTDYALALICSFFAYSFYSHPKHKLLSRLWCFFFASIATGAFLGGTLHGFFSHDSTWVHKLIWSSTLLLIGVTAASIWLIGGLLLTKASSFRRWLYFAVITFLIYAFIVLFISQNFRLTILNYFPALLFLLIVVSLKYLKNKGTYYLWIAIGILLSFFAAFIQQAKIGINPLYFNYNSTFHLIEAIAVCLIFYGAKASIRDESELA